MARLSHDILNRLLEDHQYPCISIYMPVSAAFPGEKEDPVRYRDLLDKATEELRVGYPTVQIDELIGACRDLVGEREFWNHRLSGIAVFCSPDLRMLVDLPRQVSQTMIVADSFHTKPLIRLLQAMDRYQVLCLTRKDVRLLEGDRDSLQEVPLFNVPRTIEEAFAREERMAGGDPSRPLGRAPGIVTGKIELERWFRTVDNGIWKNHSRDSGLPMILCALPENQSAFRAVSKNQNLLEQGVQLDPDHIPLERIREESWKLIEPRLQERTRQAIDHFRAAKAHHAGSDDVWEVAKSAARGRVHLALVEADRRIGGKLDPASGEVLMGDISDPMLGDLLDDTAESVLRTGGEVLVIPHELMPTDTGIAAVYRY